MTSKTNHHVPHYAIAIHFNEPQQPEWVNQDLANEFCSLITSADITIADLVTIHLRDKVYAKFFISETKLMELQQLLEELGHQNKKVDVAIFNHSLSPSQERNLERELKLKVIDRTTLILDIFAQRARSHEGKLQVELAQLEYLSTRLVRGWTHLERQKGGIGLRGPGETQLETDRRLIGHRIKKIKAQLEKVATHKEQNRYSRKKAKVLSIALVGYTNAGKSSLMNRLSNNHLYVADQLFATLDPAIKPWYVPSFGKLLLADTVGFVSNLPHSLIESFRSTLQEVAEADLLLHVIDASSREKDRHIDTVNEVLQEIGADHIPQLHVLNKIDLLDQDIVVPQINYAADGKPEKVYISTVSGLGLDDLETCVLACLRSHLVHCCIILQPDQGTLRAKFYDANAVIHEQVADDGRMYLEICVEKHFFNQYF